MTEGENKRTPYSRDLQDLSMLKEIVLLLNQERDFDRLFGRILDLAVNYTHADGATIYMVDEDEKVLKFIKVMNGSMNITLNSGEIDWEPVALYQKGKANLKNLAALCYHKKQSFNFEDVYEQDIFDSSGTHIYDERNNYRTKSIVAIPMVDHQEHVIGVIQLINSLDKAGEIQSFSSTVIQKLEMLTSISAIVLNNHKLIIDLQTSFNQFIKSIAWAIDRKSKHFSGHISRVSELVNTFANSINEYEETGEKYSDVHFSEEELEEIKIAGLMHDLGKIITPMHVLDKSRKLERIFDRVELIEERIGHLQTLIKLANVKGEMTDTEIKIENEKLRKYLEFIKKINFGSEYLSDDKKAYLDEIKNYCYEYEGIEYRIITEDEYRNLSIRRGTLTREEIDIIREHAYVTGQMLSQIRFPRYLANAPLYAEQHHEKLNGKGYPKGMTAEEIPLQSRILALSDVFEALTATRPYKKSKKLSETYMILKKMIDAYEIDAELYEFAQKRGIFIDYAKKHLKEEQIDIIKGGKNE